MNRKLLDNLISIYTIIAIFVLTLLLCYTVYNFFDAKNKGFLRMMLNTNSIIHKSYLSVKSPDGFEESLINEIIDDNPNLDSLSVYVNDEPAFVIEDQAKPSFIIRVLRKIGKETIDQSMIDENGNTIRVVVSCQTIDPDYMVGPVRAVITTIVGLIIVTFILLILEYRAGDKLAIYNRRNKKHLEDRDIDDPWYDDDIDLDESEIDIESEDLEAKDIANRLLKSKAPVIGLEDEDINENPHQLAKRLKAELELTSDDDDGEGVSYGIFDPIEKDIADKDRGYGFFDKDNIGIDDDRLVDNKITKKDYIDKDLDKVSTIVDEDNIGIKEDDRLIDNKITKKDNLDKDLDKISRIADEDNIGIKEDDKIIEKDGVSKNSNNQTISIENNIVIGYNDSSTGNKVSAEDDDDLDEAKLEIDEETLAAINNLEEEDSGDLPENIELPDNSSDLIGLEEDDDDQRIKGPIEFPIEAKKKIALFVSNLFDEQKLSANSVSVAVLSGKDNDALEIKLSKYASENGFYTDRLDNELVLAMNLSNKVDSEEVLLKLVKELDDDTINLGYTYSQSRTMKPSLLIQESLAAFNHSRTSGEHITSFDVDIESYKKEFNL